MRLIDADALEVFVKTVRQGLYLDKTLSDIPTRDSMLLNFQQYVHLQPAISAVPVVRGEWTYEHGAWACSKCGEDSPYGIDREAVKFANYCPMCGAKMRRESEVKV